MFENEDFVEAEVYLSDDCKTTYNRNKRVLDGNICKYPIDKIKTCTDSRIDNSSTVCSRKGSLSIQQQQNHVDSLLQKQFSTLSLELKKQIIELGPHQPKDFKLVVTYPKQNRSFCTSWFDKKPWLTPSIEKQALFCFYCLCFDNNNHKGNDELWTKIGCKDLKYLGEKIKKHEESNAHLTNTTNYKTLGTTNVAAQIDNHVKMSIEKHNQQVTKTRHVLSRLIDCLNFCAAHKICLREHTGANNSFNHGKFLDLVSMMADMDSVLLDHLNSSSVGKYTSHDIQQELLDCMYSVYLDELKSDVNNADFVSVQVDEVTDITCKSQFVIVFRFIKGKTIVERFVSFVEVHDRTGRGLFEVLKSKLKEYKLEDKLIAQAYDGTNTMNGLTGGVQALMQTVFINAKVVPCYAHKLTLVIKNACSNMKPVKLFFANITGFSSFFSHSPKRSDMLRKICENTLPTVPQTGWNFRSQLISSVKCLRETLIECFEQIEEGEGWDDVTTREATGLKHLLQNEVFVFFLDFFYDVMLNVEIMYNTIQKKSSKSAIVSNSFDHFEKNIGDIRKNTEKYSKRNTLSELAPPPKRKRPNENLPVVAKEVCDTVLAQLRSRFSNADIFSSFSVVDPKRFSSYRKEFPARTIETFSENYTGLVIKEKLKSELSVIYKNYAFNEIQRLSELYNFIVENDLKESFTETFKALQITMTTPVATAEAERCFSTLNRVKTFLRNTIGQDRLDALAAFSIHKEVISTIPNFHTRVIHLFANRKKRRAQLLYK